MRCLCLVLLAFSASAASGPTFDISTNISACSELHDNRGTKSKWGQSNFPLIYLGVSASMDECSSAAAKWRNSTALSQRCRSTCWYPRPKNQTYLNQCYCRITPTWMPLPSELADSAVVNWPCTGPGDCSYNGVCAAAAEDTTAGSGGCKCEVAWGGVRCGELQLLPVPRETPGFRETNASNGHSNVSTWGAPILFDNVSKQWHGWASEMTHGCGINAWETNSQIVVSSNMVAMNATSTLTNFGSKKCSTLLLMPRLDPSRGRR